MGRIRTKKLTKAECRFLQMLVDAGAPISPNGSREAPELRLDWNLFDRLLGKGLVTSISDGNEFTITTLGRRLLEAQDAAPETEPPDTLSRDLAEVTVCLRQAQNLLEKIWRELSARKATP